MVWDSQTSSTSLPDNPTHWRPKNCKKKSCLNFQFFVASSRITSHSHRWRNRQIKPGGNREIGRAEKSQFNGRRKSKCSDKSWKSCNGLVRKYWGWMSAKETLEGPKTDKKKSRKKSRMQVRVYAGHGFSTSGQGGWEKGYRWKRREKVETRRADQQWGPILYRAIPAACGAGSHPIRAVWGHYATSWARPAQHSFPAGAKRPNNSSKWG